MVRYAARSLYGDSDAKPTTSSPIDATTAENAPGPLRQPLPLLVERAGHEIERARVALDLDVVDRHDRCGIVERGEADRNVIGGVGAPRIVGSWRRHRHVRSRVVGDCRESRGGCPDRRYTRRLVRGSAASRRVPRVPLQTVLAPVKNALLAQSVEHSHGKAGVVGSIPTEGSTKWSGIRSGREPNPWRRSSVGQSIRLIIGRSSVQVRSPLPDSQISRSVTESPQESEDSNEQAEVRAQQAACEYWHDGSYRPWEDDVDGGDFEDVVGAWVG